MTPPLTPALLQWHPELASADAHLRSGQTVKLRLLVRANAPQLGAYFLGLSEQTRRFYGPHRFDQETADRLCVENDYTRDLRMLATIGEGPQETVIGYFILLLGIREDDAGRYQELGLPLDAQTDCTLAPSLADAFQNQGLGSAMMRHLQQLAFRLGRKRMVLFGGVQAANVRAVHFYEKSGFHRVGDFTNGAGLNYDMICKLQALA